MAINQSIKSADTTFLADYFEKYRKNLLNNTLNSYIKGVIKPKN